ncbi:hypothetical protein H6G33_18640 [Calothrix sp. FACHB-1219]|uniref:hypothetical protein n=1 Tax=unclassified Calothrix TaxID=2619626 RepID=UPI001684A1C8|nr:MULTISPECIES: hypothetical protein [unclassified Calothrix]MBD2203450.1 hypothetical protein [Calothrix sp. FACHB-168]MBD2219042.1 hypothetical protein [Calothrix sp. FACHB-1219]
MENLRQLLQTENSQIAQILRYSLHGIAATLNQAQTEHPLDPGVKLCDEILQEIHKLLQPKSPQPTPNNQLKLSQLKQEFDTDKDLKLYLGNNPLQSQTDAELWNEIQRKLLRIPEELAATWRQRALTLAQEIGAVEDTSNLYPLPFIRDEIIYPGLSGTIQTKGLSLSQKALSYTQTKQNTESKDINLLAGYLFFCINFIEIEPDLHHALKSVFSFDIVSLHAKPEQQNQYIEALTERFQRTQKAVENTDALLTLRAWIDIDEAIHSLVFIPPSDRYSWWGKLQQESRRMLKKFVDNANNAGNDVRIRQLSGLYADICALTKDDLQLDCGGNPGEVLACLRVYARINQEESPGRVIFRPSR